MDIHLAALKDPIIGQDFLTWLWFACEAREGRFTAEGLGTFEAVLTQKVAVQGGEGENLETATVSGPYAEMSEARQGLRSGKRVSRAMLLLTQDGAVWTLTLKADDLALTSLKTPKVETRREEGDDPDAAFLEKMFLVERAAAMLDALFAEFLALRLAPDWKRELAGYAAWLKG